MFFLFEWTSLDIIIQDNFYDFSLHRWFLSQEENTWISIIFYSGIKKLIIIFGIIILLLYLYSFKKPLNFLRFYRKGLLLVFISLLITPAIVSLLKVLSDVPCPYHVFHYGGEYPYLQVLDSKPIDIVRKFRCFPAQHASGGFALMSLFFLFQSKKNKYLALSIALLIAWSMGLYKMLLGHHYLSHTIISMLIAWCIILILYMVLTHISKLKTSLVNLGKILKLKLHKKLKRI